MTTVKYCELYALKSLIKKAQEQRTAKGNPSAGLARSIEYINKQLKEG